MIRFLFRFDFFKKNKNKKRKELLPEHVHAHLAYPLKPTGQAARSGRVAKCGV
jgi:hypothetical protein